MLRHLAVNNPSFDDRRLGRISDISELGFREMTGRGRLRAWGSI
ncbi:helix-turn-helix domain-containing protein [Rhizobium sp. LEGMi198b]